MPIFQKSKNSTRGLSIVETIVYIGLLSILLLSVVSSILTMGTAVASIKSARSISTNATNALERMIREIREMDTVDPTNSILDTNPGTLILIATSTSGATSSLRFFLSGTTLMIVSTTASAQMLTGRDVDVTNLVFRRIATSTIQAVKIEMTVQSKNGKNIRHKNYYSTTVLRGSY